MQAPRFFLDESNRPASRGPLILVGASVRSAAQSAAAAGFSVIGIDLFGDTDTLATCQQHFLLREIGDWRGLRDALPTAPLMQVGGFQRDRQIIGSLAEKFSLMGPSPQLRKKLVDPRFLRRIAKLSGLSFPPSRPCGSPPIAWQQSPSLDANSLVKNPNSCGGFGVRWAGKSIAEPAGIEPMDDDELGGEYLQEWIAGRRFGASLLSDGVATTLLGVCRSSITRKGQRRFIYAGSLGPLPGLPDAVVESLRRLGRQLTSHGLRGVFNVDLIIDRSCRGWLLEINPRWSGSSEVVERGLRNRGTLPAGNSLMGLAYAATAGPPGALRDWIGEFETNETGARGQAVFLKRIFFAKEDLRLDRRRVDRAVSHLSDEGLCVETCDLPAHHSVIQKGEPILSLIVMLSEAARGNLQVPQKLRSFTDSISVGGADHRPLPTNAMP